MDEPLSPAADAGSALADFLQTRRDSIVGLFTARVETMLTAHLTQSELVDHLPDLLDEVSRSVREGGWPTHRLFVKSPTAAAHGRQRLRLGFDLDALVREYGLLRDCIFQRLEQDKVAPSLRDLRILSDCMSGALADSVNEYTRRRQLDVDAERRHLLGMFEQAPGFVGFLRGPELVFELANEAYFQLVGHRDILGKPVREALPELEGQGFFEILDTVMATGEPFVGRGMRLAVQREPGAPLSEAIVDFVYQPIRAADGSITGVLAQGQDVTAFKRQETQREAAEAALSASEERYRTLFESIDEGFCLVQMIVDSHGTAVDYRFLELNSAFEAQTGLKDAVGKTARELVPDLDQSWFSRYGRVAATGEPTRFENYAAALGRWFDVYAARVGKPELRHVALVFKDITERKLAAQEHEQLLALESAARGEAERASRLKDEFLATVSHELRTPLNAMLGWVQMLRAGAIAPEKRDRALETIERNARAQAQLIEDLLDVSSVLAGKLRLVIEPVELGSIVEGVLETVRPAADAKGIRLQAALSSGGLVMADPQRLQQIVWNLLSNAVKFTPKGGRVQVVLTRRDSSVEIAVADTGVGIAKQFQPFVFDRFRQADGGTTRSQGGLGLGLSIVRQLVEMHGGTVSVLSEGEGHGAAFSVCLPLAATRPKEPSSPPSQHTALDRRIECPPELVGLRVLLVDDEDDTRDMLRTLLEGCGARVRSAPSVAHAMDLFAEEPPDVLLSDIGMPDEDGYSFIGKVRRLPAASGGTVPAIALTAYARSEDRTRALLAGFSTHVPKPVEPTELLAVIASMVARTGRPRES